MILSSIKSAAQSGMRLAALGLFALSLASCGGGGGSPGAVNGSSGTTATALFVTAPADLTMATNSVQTFTIGGGSAPYTVSSSNTTLATVGIAPATATLTINSLAAGTAKINVFDSAGKSVSINLTVGSGGTSTTFFITAASAVTIPVGSTQTYTVGGGTAPYSTSSSAAAIASATVSGTTLSITALKDGKSDISIFDVTGKVLTTSVTAGNGGGAKALFTTAPANVTLSSGATSYSVDGGTAPYTASSGNSAVVAASVSGATLTLNAVSGGTALVNVLDAAGASVAINVTVGSSNPLFINAPAAISIGVGATTAQYTVSGGSLIYTATSSNTGVAMATMTGSRLTITGVASGTAVISVFDSTGKTVNTTVTVGSTITPAALFVTAPSAVTLGAGASPTYVIGGGTGPYIASSSNTGVATATVSGTNLVITAVADGSAVISVFDTTGKAVSTTVTVGTSAATLYVTAPSAIAQGVGELTTFSIGGGSAPYTASSSNVGIAQVTVNKSALTIRGVTAGTAQIAVFDTAGKSVTVSVTVGNTNAAAALFITAPNAVSIGAGGATATYTFSGGTGPYVATSSNTSVAGVALSGNSITVTGQTAGSAQVAVFDSTGKAVSIDVTVVSGGAAANLFTTAPPAVTIAINATSTYQIGGGTSPYTATSSNTAVVTANASGSSMSIKGIFPGTAQVVVLDGTGKTVTINVTVSPVATSSLAVLPAGATANVGDVLSFQISGGTPGYSVNVNNPSIAQVAPTTVSASGGVFTATLTNAGTTSVAVVDALGNTSNFVLTVNLSNASLRLSPSAFEVGENTLQPITLFIYGGTAPYTTFTSDTLKSAVAITGTAGAPSLTVSFGSSGNRCINPVDSTGKYVPSGSYNTTVTVLDSKGASATSVMTIRDNGAGLGAGCP